VNKLTATLSLVDDDEDALCASGQHGYDILINNGFFVDAHGKEGLKAMVFCAYCGCLITYESHESKESTL
jgi:hypothetical protein